MNIGLDIGYSDTKAIGGDDRRAHFPSVVGTPDKARFSLNHTDGYIILTAPQHVQIGAGAINQSRFLKRREDRGWITSTEWAALFAGAMSELTTSSVEARVVTGLPVNFFQGDKDALRSRLLGEHKIQRETRHAQVVRVTECAVIPQPFGALLAATLDNSGRIADTRLATGLVGIIDIGGKTTNLLSVNNLAEISHETESVNIGAWDVVRAVRAWLADNCPSLDLRDHQIIEAIIARKVRYFGQDVNLGAIVDQTLEPLADQVRAAISQLWNDGAGLDAILLAGGGALLLGQHITRGFPHAAIVENPVFANALGYWRFAQRIGNTKQ